MRGIRKSEKVRVTDRQRNGGRKKKETDVYRETHKHGDRQTETNTGKRRGKRYK